MKRLAFLLFLLTQASPAALAAPYVDAKNQFRITAPKGWGAAPLSGRMVWHVAANGGTELPDCGVIVSQDSSFSILGNDRYINSQSKEKLKGILSLNFQNVVIGNWEPNFRLGGQRALHYIYTGTIEGERQTTLGIQTVRGGKLYTFSCNAPSAQFPSLYLDLLKVSDTFTFTQQPSAKAGANLPPGQVRP